MGIFNGGCGIKGGLQQGREQKVDLGNSPRRRTIWNSNNISRETKTVKNERAGKLHGVKRRTTNIFTGGKRESSILLSLKGKS